MHAAFETSLPAVIALEQPIALFDSLLCKSLDLVEERIPMVTLPPAVVSAETELVCVSLKTACCRLYQISFIIDMSKYFSLT